MTKQNKTRHPAKKIILPPPLQHRYAGILMHITSLPSLYGIGDLGPEALKFADFLSQSGQRYWQVLPINPTGADQNYSPYSAVSSMAGNTLLISPEMMVNEELLQAQDLRKLQIHNAGKVNYKEAEQLREGLFEKAFRNFQMNTAQAIQAPFREFCLKESSWLDDFALYVVLKEQHKDKPWYEWPAPFKLRQPKALAEIVRNHAERLNKVKWLQFVFFNQWNALKEYCNQQNIYLFGDLPFYVSYDSADVWSHADLFKLDGGRSIKGVAGVPPDYFNKNGQLWGMPVFKWDVLKKQDYKWWVDRVRKNMELFDVIRLDHFRAFAGYWEVPAEEKTAVNGKWKKGPGNDIFKVLKSKLGRLPFVAEDLGDIDAPVHQLREEFGLPGMKILQFAFGDNLPQSDYIPHNYTENFVVYTGTHDNNTSVGWWLKDTKNDVRANLKQYTDDLGISQNNIHLILSKMAYASVARTVILPIQDVLGLDDHARMNTPATVKGNWMWRLKPDQISPTYKNQLLKWARLYNRL